MQSAIERYLKEKTIHGWASCESSFTTQKKKKENPSVAELHRLHPQVLSPKTTKSLSVNHRRKEVLPSLIQAKRTALWCMKDRWKRLLSLSLQNCFFVCYASMSFRHMTSFCILNKSVSGSAISNKSAWLRTIHQNLKLKAKKQCDFKMDLIKW